VKKVAFCLLDLEGCSISWQDRKLSNLTKKLKKKLMKFLGC